MDDWEYQALELDCTVKYLNEYINILGLSGWELISANFIKDLTDTEKKFFCFFKRRLNRRI